MFERFTKFARAAIPQAQEEARRFNSPSVGPEHIFLSLVGQPEAVAGWVLAQLGVTLDAARSRVESLVGRGDQPVQGEIPFSPAGKKVLKVALDEARRLKHNYIGTEHMFLALFQLPAAPILDLAQQFHLNVDRVRDLILQELALGKRRLSSPTEGTRNNVVMCRVSGADLEAIDSLVEAGVRTTRSDAAAWLIRAGIEGNKPLVERLRATVREIRRLREQAQAISREVASGQPVPPLTRQGGEPVSDDEARPDV